MLFSVLRPKSYLWHGLPFFWARPRGIEPPPALGSHLLPYLGLGHWKKAAVGGAGKVEQIRLSHRVGLVSFCRDTLATLVVIGSVGAPLYVGHGCGKFALMPLSV